MTDEIAAIDAQLQALFAGEEMRSVPALVAFGQPALDRLLDVMAGRVPVSSKGGQREQQEALIDVIVAFAKQDLDSVLKGVEARGLEGSVTTVWALGCVVDPRVVPLLVRSAASEASLERWMAVSGLARQRDPRATEALIRSLKDRASNVRDVAAEALGKMGDPRAIEPLEAALSSGNARRFPHFARTTKAALDELRRRTRAKG